MKITNFSCVALAFAAALVAIPDAARAQAINSNDTFQIDVPYTVTIGHKVLQPGTYTVEPLNLAGGDAPVLVIRGTDNTKTQINAKIVPTAENRVQPETRVLFHHVGGRYYFDRIWAKGAIFGYKFELPKGVRASTEEK